MTDPRLATRPAALRPAALVLAGLLLTACGGDGGGGGAAAALDDAGFVSCLESTPPEEGNPDAAALLAEGDLDAEQQRALWTAPGALLCAVEELDAEQRAAAWEEPFADAEDERYPDDVRDQQLVAVAELAEDAATAGGEDRAVDAVATLLSQTPLGAGGDAEAARRVAATVTLAVGGEATGFADWAGDAPADDPGPYLSYDRHAEEQGLTEVVQRLESIASRIDATTTG